MKMIKRIYDFLSAMNTGLGLLVILGASAALGSTFLPDGFYNSSFFKLLLLILLLNMTLCTLNRLLRLRWSANNTGRRRPQLKTMAVVLLHGGIILVLVGGSINACTGSTGQVRMMPGDTVDVSSIIEVKHPFVMRLDDFRIEFNDDGSPSQYYSSVSILEQEAVQEQQVISVNYPMKYRSIKAYQQSFGHLARLEWVDGNGGRQSKLLEEGEILHLPGTGRTVKFFRYIPDFDPGLGMNTRTMRPDNPRIIFSVYENEELLGVGAARPEETITVDEGSDLTFAGVEPFTVLQVKSDPGLPVAAGGGILFMMGVSMSVLLTPAKRKSGSPDNSGD